MLSHTARLIRPLWPEVSSFGADVGSGIRYRCKVLDSVSCYLKQEMSSRLISEHSSFANDDDCRALVVEP